MNHAPSALIVPISINNSWKLLRYGKFPYGIGTHIKIRVHEPVEVSGVSATILDSIERTIHSAIKTS